MNSSEWQCTSTSKVNNEHDQIIIKIAEFEMLHHVTCSKTSSLSSRFFNNTSPPHRDTPRSFGDRFWNTNQKTKHQKEMQLRVKYVRSFLCWRKILTHLKHSFHEYSMSEFELSSGKKQSAFLYIFGRGTYLDVLVHIGHQERSNVLLQHFAS